MDITEVRISPVGGRDDKLRAFCSVTFDDCFVVRDIRLIEGNKGLFIAMPSRKLTIRCPRCHFKNAVRSQYCNECGNSIPRALSDDVEQGRTKLHADIAHPILTSFREEIQDRVLDAYEEHHDEASEHRSSRREAVPVGAEEEEESPPSNQYRARGPAEEPDEVSSIPAAEEAEATGTDSAEADFLGKNQADPDDGAFEEEEEEEEESVDMPPPDDNFSSGLF